MAARLLRSCCALLLGSILLAGVTPAAAQLPQTGAERSGFERHTSHLELMEFLHELQSRTDRMLIRTLATAGSGRGMPLVLLGAPPTATPGTAFFSGKPLVLITGNVHGDELAGREGTLQLIRDLTVGEARTLLDAINVLVVPTLNPDGAESRTRRNSVGYDLNRDFIVAETPEISALLEEVLLQWWPDVYVDVHNGGAYPYHLTYQATLHPGADAQLVAFARGPMYDAVRRHMEARQLRMYWYSGPRQNEQTGEWSWHTTEPWARKQHSYAGLHNVIALLYEIPGRWTLREQAASTREGLLGLLHFVAANASDVRAAVTEARRRTLHDPAPDVAVRMEETAHPDTEQFLVMSDGEPRLVTGTNRTRFVAATVRSRPWAYAFDGSLHRVAALLRRHAIEVERLDAPADAAVEDFRLDSIHWSAAPYHGHIPVTARVTTLPASRTLAAGTYLVRMSQNAAALIAELLEPDTEDSVLVWNLLDAVLPGGEALARRSEPFVLPVYRVLSPVGVRSTLVDGRQHAKPGPKHGMGGCCGAASDYDLQSRESTPPTASRVYSRCSTFPESCGSLSHKRDICLRYSHLSRNQLNSDQDSDLVHARRRIGKLFRRTSCQRLRHVNLHAPLAWLTA